MVCAVKVMALNNIAYTVKTFYTLQADVKRQLITMQHWSWRRTDPSTAYMSQAHVQQHSAISEQATVW